MNNQHSVTSTAFPLRLKYPEEGYNKVLIASLHEGSPLLTWSKKVAQWNSKLNGFCYLKRFTRCSHAIIANVLGPFPEGQKVRQFVAFEHTDTSHLHIDTTSPQTYHYRWAHKRPLGPTYLGRFDKAGHYGGKTYTPRQFALAKSLGIKKYTPQQIALAKGLGLPWATRPSNSRNWHNHAEPVHTLSTDNQQCFKCRKEGHIARYCPLKSRIKTQDAEYGRLAPTQNEPPTVLERLVHAVKKVADSEEKKEQLFELIIKKGIFSVKELAALSRTLHLHAVYRFNSANKLELPTKIRSYKGTTMEPALVDSGAMENFVDRNLVERLRLGTRPLERPIKLRNIDGTYNTTGEIMHYIDLMMCRADKKVKERFYITGLSGIELILGYPWLRDFNPQVDWPTNTLPGPLVETKTLLQDKITQYTRSQPTTPPKVDPVDLSIRATITKPTPTFPEELVQATKKAVTGMTKEQVHALIFEAAMPQVHLNRAVPKKQDPSPSTPMEQKPVEDLSTTAAPKETTTKEQVPGRYHNFLDIFEKPVAGQLPPHRKWDLKVRLIPNAPSSISCTLYPLSRAEQVFQDKYIKENLAHGFI
jgi:hypothetical protein